MRSLLTEENDPALDALLLELGREQLLDELDQESDRFEDECEDLVIDRHGGIDIGNGVEWWTLIELSRGQNGVMALLEGIVRIFPADEVEGTGMTGSAVYVRISLREVGGVWRFASGEVLPDDDFPHGWAEESR